MGITRTNGTQEKLDTPKPFEEIGSTGLPSYSGYITKAYLPALQWPTCEPAYSKIWRSDPETIMAWQMFSALAGKVNITWELPEQIGNRELPPPNDADKRALDFCWSVTSELDGGLNGWLSDEVTHTPFYGWRLWSTPMGKRSTGWKPPNPTDPWRSKENDGLIGIRRFMPLDYSTFSKWILDKQTGRVLGWEQNDLYNGSGTVKIPIDYMIHTRYGDMSNPEGIAVLEGMYWLEYAQRQLEKIQAIGYERTAGYLAFEADRPLTPQDDPYIRNAARAVLAAQESNYLALPQGLKANIIDTPFAAATTLLEAIRYYSIRKLALLGVQFIAMSTMSGTGSYAALDDSSSMAILMFNSIVQGSVRQLSEQLTDKLFKWNAASFAGMSRTPVLHAAPIDKAIGLAELAAFSQAIKDVMPLGDDDFIAIRKKSEFLPEALPEIDGVDTPEGDGGISATSEDAPENIESTKGLNGAQITAALKILEGVVSGATPGTVAIELLVSLGVERQKAVIMVNATKSTGKPAIDEPAGDEPMPEDEELPGELAQSEKVKPKGGAITVTGASVTKAEIDRAVNKFTAWAKTNAPGLSDLLEAEVPDTKDES